MNRNRRPTRHTGTAEEAADALQGIPLEEAVLMVQRMRWALGPEGPPALAPLAPSTGRVLDHEISRSAGQDIPPTEARRA